MLYMFSKVKGGAAGTTTSTHAAVWLANQGEGKTLLLDVDKVCRSASYWDAERREAKGAKATVDVKFAAADDVEAVVQEALTSYANIVIDSPGHDDDGTRAALLATGEANGVVLCPVAPRGVETWAAPLMRNVIVEARDIYPDLRLAYFLAKADTRGSDEENEKAAAFLRSIEGADFLESRVGYRKAIGTAATHGLTCWELPYARRSREASAEMNALMAEIRNYAHVNQ